MARIRTIKPEFPQSESMGRVSREARLLFVLLWTICDDAGRVRGNSRMLASLLYPYDDDAKDKIEGWLGELEDESCIARYEAEGGTYLQCTNWLKHQKIDKPTASKIPEFARAREEATTDLVPSTLDLGPLRLSPNGSGESRKKPSKPKPSSKPLRSEPEGFAEFYNQYPKHEDRGHASPAYAKALKKTDAATLLAAATAFRAKRAAENPQYTPLCATWLNGERWLDEAPAPASPPLDLETAAEREVRGWRTAVGAFKRHGAWPLAFGPKPDEPGCTVPTAVLAEFGYDDMPKFLKRRPPDDRAVNANANAESA